MDQYCEFYGDIMLVRQIAIFAESVVAKQLDGVLQNIVMNMARGEAEHSTFA